MAEMYCPQFCGKWFSSSDDHQKKSPRPEKAAGVYVNKAGKYFSFYMHTHMEKQESPCIYAGFGNFMYAIIQEKGNSFFVYIRMNGGAASAFLFVFCSLLSFWFPEAN